MEQRRHTLLVVDDEVDVLESLRHQFHRGYRVLTSASGKHAIEILLNEDVELILTDQRMPGMSGDQFLREARRLKPDAIRMLFTGYADIQAVISAVNEGHIFRYILKPWDSAELEGIIHQGVEQYNLLAERKRLVAELQAANLELVQANLDLARAGQLKTAFIEVASHEFNTPITLVLGFTELLRLSSPSRTEHEQEIIRQISTSGRQLARLVTNMLTLLRAEDFRKTMERRPVPLADLIERVVEQMRPFTHVRRHVLELRVGRRLGHVRDRCRQVERGLDQPVVQRDQVHARWRHDRAGGKAFRARRCRDTRERSWRGLGATGGPALVSAVLHPVRPQPPLIGRFRILQARAGAWLEHCETVCGDAWWSNQRREPGRWRNTGHGLSAALRKCCRKASGS